MIGVLHPTRWLRSALCWIACASLPACALNPVSGRPEFVLVSAKRERQLGQEEAARVARFLGVLDDSPHAAYVAAVGQRLAALAPRRDVAWAFHVVDMAEANAFALPSGDIYVSRGLLALANSEDEIAGVIAHEIGHVAARHTVQQISRQAPLAIVIGLPAVLTGMLSPALGQIVGGLGQLTSGLIFASYSRAQEREADRFGQELAARAGWDPAGLAAFLHTLEREEALHPGDSGRPRFFDSHPRTPERVQTTAAYAHKLQRAPSNPIAATRTDFLARLEGVVVGGRAANGVFDGPRFLHPELDLSLSFPPDWQYQNAPLQVAALAPDRGALVLLQLLGEGTDPMSGARALEQASRTPVVARTRSLTVNGLPAARTFVRVDDRQGPVGIDLTWIAHRSHIYQIAGIAALARISDYTAVITAVVESFAPLAPADRARIKEDRLRSAAARPGESLGDLLARVSSSWDVDMAAVANARSVSDLLTGGEHLKVAVPELYRSATPD
jgi:predicted Zn-dependent protease